MTDSVVEAPSSVTFGSVGRASDAPLQRLWRRLPVSWRRQAHAALNWTGLPLAASHLVSHRRRHAPERFAARLVELHHAYAEMTHQRRALTDQFDAIADALVLPNGVRKTTYAGRAAALLAEILDDRACSLSTTHGHRVLDLPASTGAASLTMHAVISRRVSIAEYVLADLAFHLLYDRARDCIFDDTGALLQVGTARGFESVYLPHVGGDGYSALSRLLLAPIQARGAELRDRYRADDAVALEQISLLHPEVLEGCRDGRFTLATMNVFESIEGPFDLICCFNLLQRNYFSAADIRRGIDNLAAALADDGLLIVGAPDAGGRNPHRVYRRSGDELRVVRERGPI